MTTEKRYKILELATQGWSLVDKDCQHLTKEQCDIKLKDLIGVGVNPNSIKVVLQGDNRFTADRTDSDGGFLPPPT